MNKKVKLSIITILLVLDLIGAILLYINNLYGYFLITLGLLIILVISLIMLLTEKTDDESKYNNNLKNILKRYDSILVETSSIPDMDGKNMMMITNIEDMIDASVEIRKPIYYKKEEDHCIFVLLDNQDISLFILKLDEFETPLEKLIKDRKNSIQDLISQARENKSTKKEIKEELIDITNKEEKAEDSVEEEEIL